MNAESPDVKAKKDFTDYALGIILAISLFFTGVYSWNKIVELQQTAPATNWVEVTSLTIPNFKEGVDPNIDYVRDIKQAVSSSWTSEVRRYFDEGDDYEIACTNAGFSELEPGRPTPAKGWFLSSFAGKNCKLGEGRYRLFVNWSLKPKGFDRTIPYPMSSNAFVVQS